MKKSWKQRERERERRERRKEERERERERRKREEEGRSKSVTGNSIVTLLVHSLAQLFVEEFFLSPSPSLFLSFLLSLLLSLSLSLSSICFTLETNELEMMKERVNGVVLERTDLSVIRKSQFSVERILDDERKSERKRERERERESEKRESGMMGKLKVEQFKEEPKKF